MARVVASWNVHWIHRYKVYIPFYSCVFLKVLPNVGVSDRESKARFFNCCREELFSVAFQIVSVQFYVMPHVYRM